MIAQEPILSIARKCAIMNVSRSGYYDWRQREVSLRELANNALDAHIQAIYHDHAGRYGYGVSAKNCVIWAYLLHWSGYVDA